MKTLFSIVLFVSLAVLGLTACGGSGANANAYANKNANTGSKIGNAVNTAVNTVANATGSTSPEDFVKEAAQGGMAEVEMGKLAVKNSQDPDVKKFGQMMIDDHSKANAELQSIAEKKNIPVPTDIGSNRSSVEKIESLKGPAFDKAYVDLMVSDHKEDIKAFEDQAENGKDPDIKAFAAKTLPTLKKHLSAIQDIQDKMAKKEAR
jgi:putative membrane protein